MGDAKDPREGTNERHPDKDVKVPSPPANSDARDAPGGVGTDTDNDPANEPAAQPKSDRNR